MITPAVASTDTFAFALPFSVAFLELLNHGEQFLPVRRCLHSCPSSPSCVFSVRFCTTFVVLEELDFVIDTAYLMVDAKKISICAE